MFKIPSGAFLVICRLLVAFGAHRSLLRWHVSYFTLKADFWERKCMHTHTRTHTRTHNPSTPCPALCLEVLLQCTVTWGGTSCLRVWVVLGWRRTGRGVALQRGAELCTTPALSSCSRHLGKTCGCCCSPCVAETDPGSRQEGHMDSPPWVQQGYVAQGCLPGGPFARFWASTLNGLVGPERMLIEDGVSTGMKQILYKVLSFWAIKKKKKKIFIWDIFLVWVQWKSIFLFCVVCGVCVPVHKPCILVTSWRCQPPPKEEHWRSPPESPCLLTDTRDPSTDSCPPSPSKAILGTPHAAGQKQRVISFLSSSSARHLRTQVYLKRNRSSRSNKTLFLFKDPPFTGRIFQISKKWITTIPLWSHLYTATAV